MISRGLEARVISIDPPAVEQHAIVRLVPEFPGWRPIIVGSGRHVAPADIRQVAG
jgi:hypothetical protein